MESDPALIKPWCYNRDLFSSDDETETKSTGKKEFDKIQFLSYIRNKLKELVKDYKELEKEEKEFKTKKDKLVFKICLYKRILEDD